MKRFFMTVGLVYIAFSAVTAHAQSLPVIYNCREQWGYGPASALCESKTIKNNFLIFANDPRGVNPGDRAYYVNVSPQSCRILRRFGIRAGFSYNGNNKVEMNDYSTGQIVVFKSTGTKARAETAKIKEVFPRAPWADDFKNCSNLKR
ncbi:MAG: hypothetical protein ABL958_14265 [Bdellovibrionia bacterium]